MKKKVFLVKRLCPPWWHLFDSFRAQVFLGLPSMQSGVARHQQLQRNCLGTNMWLSIEVIACCWLFLTVAVDVQLFKRCVMLDGFAQIFHTIFANGVICSSRMMVIGVMQWICTSCFSSTQTAQVETSQGAVLLKGLAQRFHAQIADSTVCQVPLMSMTFTRPTPFRW